MHAALGRAQLKKLKRNNQCRRNLLVSYREAVRPLGDWTMPFAHTIDDSSGHLMIIVAPDPDIREGVHALRKSGIQSSMHYPEMPGTHLVSKSVYAEPQEKHATQMLVARPSGYSDIASFVRSEWTSESHRLHPPSA